MRPKKLTTRVPFQALELVFLRLSLRLVLVCAAVCKEWREMIRNFKKDFGNWLFFVSSEGLGLVLAFDPSEGSWHKMQLPISSSCYVLDTCKGLVCLSTRKRTQLVVCNPLTGWWKSIPKRPGAVPGQRTVTSMLVDENNTLLKVVVLRCKVEPGGDEKEEVWFSRSKKEIKPLEIGNEEVDGYIAEIYDAASNTWSSHKSIGAHSVERAQKHSYYGKQETTKVVSIVSRMKTRRDNVVYFLVWKDRGVCKVLSFDMSNLSWDEYELPSEDHSYCSPEYEINGLVCIRDKVLFIRRRQIYELDVTCKGWKEVQRSAKIVDVGGETLKDDIYKEPWKAFCSDVACSVHGDVIYFGKKNDFGGQYKLVGYNMVTSEWQILELPKEHGNYFKQHFKNKWGYYAEFEPWLSP